MTRFDARRQLITQEANCIGTAYTRLDLLPRDLQGPLRDMFGIYLDSRLEVYRKLPDLRAASSELARSEQIQGQIWQQSLAACRQSQSQPATMLLVPALNQMFDIASTRTAVTRIHPPMIVFIMLCIVSLATALLAGCSMAGTRKRNWIYILGFPFIISLTVYVIIDIEFPRIGLIRIDAFDRALVELRESMK